MSKKILMALLVALAAATAPVVALADCCQPSSACCGSGCCGSGR
jgi:hypothetical protein